MADVNQRMEKDESDESSDSDAKESKSILKNPESQKAKNEASIKRNGKSDEDNKDVNEKLEMKYLSRMAKETPSDDELPDIDKKESIENAENEEENPETPLLQSSRDQEEENEADKDNKEDIINVSGSQKETRLDDGPPDIDEKESIKTDENAENEKENPHTPLLQSSSVQKEENEAGKDNKEDINTKKISKNRTKKDRNEEETIIAGPSDNHAAETQLVVPPNAENERAQWLRRQFLEILGQIEDMNNDNDSPDIDEIESINTSENAENEEVNPRRQRRVQEKENERDDDYKDRSFWQFGQYGSLLFSFREIEEGGEEFIKNIKYMKYSKNMRNSGTILFKGLPNSNCANFWKILDETPANFIFHLMTKSKSDITHEPYLTHPNILISITGGAKLFKMKEDLKELLRDGLRKITQSPATWVITGGTNDSISKFVGESLQGVAESLIGISTWVPITDTDSLSEIEYGLLSCTVDSSLPEHRTFLDHNHGHHLLVDDTSIGEYEKEIPLVSRLLKYTSYQRDGKAVVLLLAGGIDSLENVLNAVVGEQPIPVLVVNGSGRAADVLCYAMQCSIEKVHISLEKCHSGLEDYIAKNMCDSEDDKTELYKKVMECMQHRDMISVVTLNKDEGIDGKIYEAILKHYALTNEQRLQYTVLCNRFDMAEDLFLDTSIKLEKKHLEDSMVMALALNRCEVVEFFVDNNVSIHKLVTQPLLEFLYNRGSMLKPSIVYHYVGSTNASPVHARFLALLNEKDYKSTNIMCYKDIYNFLSSLCKKKNFHMPQVYETDDSRTEDDDELNWYSKYPYRDLFLWAVVNNMQDMAKLLWKLGDEQIAKAIVAAEFNRILAEKAEEKYLPNEIIQVLKKNEIEFRELALKVLDSCYTKSLLETTKLLTSELAQFSSQNCIKLANELCFQEFIAHTAVQQVLTDLWCGKLSYRSYLINIGDDWIHYEIDIIFREPARTGKKLKCIQDSDRSRTYMLQDGQQQYNGSDNQNKHLITQYLSYHFDAPIRKFIRSLVSYCIFLMLISYCAALKKEDATPNVIEIIVFVWVTSYALEELYQVSVTSDATILHKLYNHLNSFFNVVDLTALTLYFIAFALQLNSSSMEYGHILYAIDAMFWIVRLLQYFYASKILGTYVIMIGKMTIDMCYFISILLVFLLAYGVLSSAILRPETRIFNMIKNIVYFPYFNIYGELFADNDSSPGMTKFGTKVINDYAEPISWFFLGLFLLVANVLLMNLLIAVFGNTFAEVKKKADQIWRFHRHDLITEYALKLSFPPPFTVFIYIWKKISTCKKSPEQVHFNTPFRRNELNDFQRKNCMNVLRVQKTELKKDTINEKLEKLNEQNKTLQEQTKDFNKTMGTKMDKMESYLTDIRAINEKNS